MKMQTFMFNYGIITYNEFDIDKYHFNCMYKQYLNNSNNTEFEYFAIDCSIDYGKHIDFVFNTNNENDNEYVIGIHCTNYDNKHSFYRTISKDRIFDFIYKYTKLFAYVGYNTISKRYI